MMAHVISAPAGVSLTARIHAAFAGVVVSWMKARDFQQTFKELDALTDHELYDIGVRRCDIGDIARRHVYG